MMEAERKSAGTREDASAGRATTSNANRGAPSLKRPFGALADSKKTPPIQENDYEEDEKWGGGGHGRYMAVKKRKLLEQFADAALQVLPAGPEESSSTIFRGVSVYVNGSTHPSADEIKRLMMLHGGQYHLYYSSSKTSHTIASNLPYTKIVQLKGQQVVKPEWITESIRAGRLLPWQNFELYPVVTHHQKRASIPKEFIRIPIPTEDGPGTSKKDSIQRASPEKALLDAAPIAYKAGDPNYLNQFYARSRLHHLSLWKVEAKQLVEQLQEQNDGTFPGRQRLREHFRHRMGRGPSPISGSVIMHIDFDSFFVSVGLLSRPHLAGKAVACCHGRSGYGKLKPDGPDDGKAGQEEALFNSKSEVASCNYIARKAGLKNGMYLGPAKQLCPGLVTIPYEFEEYKRISTIFYQTVASYTLNIEAISCDEMIVDCTDLLRDLHTSPDEFAAFLRKEIFEKSGGCHASAGLAANPLLARLATKKAKPNGHFYLAPEEVTHFLTDIPIADLPGVGRSAMEKFRDLNAMTCGHLRKIPLERLQSVFGQKIGQKFYNYARGIDEHEVQNETSRKSVSAEINYGMRMTAFQEFKSFFEELSAEMERRLKTARVRGSTITLKLMVRHPDAPFQPEKFMGCGLCNSLNKSISLLQPTDSADIIAKEGLALFKRMSIDVKEVRGIGVQLTRLLPAKKPILDCAPGDVFRKREKVQKEVDIVETDEGDRNEMCQSPELFASDGQSTEQNLHQLHPRAAILDISCGQPDTSKLNIDDLNDDSLTSSWSAEKRQPTVSVGLPQRTSPALLPTLASYYNLQTDVGWLRLFHKLAGDLRSWIASDKAPVLSKEVLPLFTQPAFLGRLSLNFNLACSKEMLRQCVSHSLRKMALPAGSGHSSRGNSLTPEFFAAPKDEAAPLSSHVSSSDLELPLTQPYLPAIPREVSMTSISDKLDAASKAVMSEMLEDTECKFWLNHFDIPEDIGMTEMPTDLHGATLTYLDTPRVTRQNDLGGKFSTPIVRWAIWKLNAVYGDDWLQTLMGHDGTGLKDTKQALLQLQPVTATQAVRQLNRNLTVRGSLSYAPLPAKAEKVQMKLDLGKEIAAPLPSTSIYPSASQLDPDVLAALPADLREEIFESCRRTAANTASTSGVLKKKPLLSNLQQGHVDRPKGKMGLPVRKQQTRKRTEKAIPNQPSIENFVKRRKTAGSPLPQTSCQKSAVIETVILNSDGEEIGQETPITLTPVEWIIISTPPEAAFHSETPRTKDAPMLFANVKDEDIQEAVASLVENGCPDDAFRDAVVQWCQEQLEKNRLSLVDGLLRSFYRDVDFLPLSKTRSLWVDSYRIVAEKLAQRVKEVFGSLLALRSF